MPTRQSGGTKPAPPKDKSDTPKDCPVFPWYDNKVQEGLQQLYRRDLADRQVIVETIEELSDANLFWKLFSAYENAVSEARQAEEPDTAPLLALLARIYIAGTLRGSPLINE